jgi:3-isopropylmalate/(R)-2-methylmalate dehydratase small subunit
MSKDKTITGRGIPLVGNDIDTDRIIPARFLRCITFDGLGAQVFADDRKGLQGNHPFDLPQYQGAKILVVNNNFGCGSSREHAPQAIAKWGIQALVGESFAEIFLGNCLAMGLPCVTASSEGVSALQSCLTADPELNLSLDLEAMHLRGGDLGLTVRMADSHRQMILSGTWDACALLLSQRQQITATAQQLPYFAWN